MLHPSSQAVFDFIAPSPSFYRHQSLYSHLAHAPMSRKTQSRVPGTRTRPFSLRSLTFHPPCFPIRSCRSQLVYRADDSVLHAALFSQAPPSIRATYHSGRASVRQDCRYSVVARFFIVLIVSLSAPGPVPSSFGPAPSYLDPAPPAEGPVPSFGPVPSLSSPVLLTLGPRAIIVWPCAIVSGPCAYSLASLLILLPCPFSSIQPSHVSTTFADLFSSRRTAHSSISTHRSRRTAASPSLHFASLSLVLLCSSPLPCPFISIHPSHMSMTFSASPSLRFRILGLTMQQFLPVRHRSMFDERIEGR